VVPEIMVRSTKDLSDLHTNNNKPFEYFFDKTHFLTSLSTACPQMTVYSDINDLYMYPSTANPIDLSPQGLTTEFVHGTVLAHPEQWRNSFDSWLHLQAPTFNAAMPVLIKLATPLLQFPITYDTPALANQFGRILRFREDCRRLASTILYNMSQKFGLELKSDTQVTPGKFYGAHLRTASDAIKAGWMGYEEQAKNYLDHALFTNLTTIYVTSGSPSDIARFKTQATAQIGANVTTKHELLSQEDAAALNSLTWDQQGLVDYEVLLRSSAFGGIDQSSFAWNIAMRRHVLSTRQDYLESGKTLVDEFSILFGPQGSMELCGASMWP
jgi:hypothetical protein